MFQVELIRHWGYPAEEHAVQTEDGYILALQRIPWGREAPATPRTEVQPRPVVLFQHGILQSADQWLLRGPGRDLGKNTSVTASVTTTSNHNKP